jgi:DNA-binding CsgD family transcriptional regulator
VEVIGRENELSGVATFLDAIPKGSFALLLVGEAGIGKTTIWQAGIEMARDRGFRILSSRASGAETQLPFTGLADLLDAVPDPELSSLPRPQRHAIDVALLRGDSEGSLPDWRAVSVAVLSVLRSLSTAGPVLVALDDVQWLDPPSARALAFAARRLVDEQFGLLLAQRGSVDASAPLGLDRSVPSDRLRRLEVRALRSPELDRIIRDRLGTGLHHSVLREVGRVSGGNPFFALELARALLARGDDLRPGEPLRVPETLTQLLSDRLEALPSSARAVVEVASALTQPTPATVKDAVGRQVRAVSGLDVALQAGILAMDGSQLRFTHPLIASTVYARMTASRRRQVHRRLAQIVDDPEERARHLALAVLPPDAEVAAALEGGAGRAAARGAPEAAAELLEMAARFTPRAAPGEARRRLVEAAGLYEATTNPERARALLEEVVPASPAGIERATALRALAWVRMHDSIADGIDLFEHALEETEQDRTLRASVLYGLGAARSIGGDFPGGLAHHRAALDLAESVGDPSLLNLLLGAVAWGQMIIGQGVDDDLLRRQRELEEAHPVWSNDLPSEDIGVMLMWADDLAGARARQEYVRDGYEERGIVEYANNAVMMLSEVEYRAGNFELAATYADQAMEILPEGEMWDTSLFGFRRAQAYAHLGRVEVAREEALRGAALGERLGTTRLTFPSLGVLGYLDLSMGDPAAAHENLGRAVEMARSCGIGEPGLIRFVPDEIEALIALGLTDEAKSLLDWWEERSRETDRAYGLATSARCRGLLLASLGDTPGALAALEEAMAHHDRIPDQRFELARTLLVQGEVHRRARHKRAARESLDRALHLFEEMHARLWAERARAESARIGGRPPAPLELTPTEARVADLVAVGRTNREVASALFMSDNTVEDNLKRIYRKLGVRSRAELAARFAPTDRVDGGRNPGAG